MNWFYASNGAQQGPVSEDELRALIQSGTINATTQVWQEGMADWKPLSAARPDLAPSSAMAAAHPALKDLSVQAMREGALSSIYSGPLNYAGFWIRFAAKLIDGILMWIVQFIIQMGVVAVTAVSMRAGSDGSTSDPAAAAAIAMALLSVVLSILVQALYNGIMIGKYGATLGKMACGLKVVMPDGSPVSMPRAFGRFFAEFLSYMILCIGYIIAAFDEEKRALHDHIASTRVITTR